MEPWITALAFVALIVCFLRAKKSRNGSLPPGPWRVPFLGHLHLLGELPHRSLQKLSKKYGPIMSLRLGSTPTIVVSSPEYAELFLKTHDSVFASRPKQQSAELMAFGQKNVSFAQYGPYWRNIRKLCTMELLTSSKIESFKPMRKEELTLFVESLKNESKSGSVIDITAHIETLVSDMTYRMVLGTKDGMSDFKFALREAVRLTGLFNLADYVPSLGKLDVKGLHGQMKATQGQINGFLERIIDDHVADAKELQGKHRDFVDVMLSMVETSKPYYEMQLDLDSIKAVVVDVLAAAMDTSCTGIEWILFEILKSSRIMNLVQEELVNVVGLDRMVEEKDLSKLTYLNMVMKECMRVHPVAPLLIPHESTEDTTVNGYFIPKNSRIIINAWAIGQDTNVWSENADEFCPERFVGSDIDVQGHDFELIPFGSGRRKCPGMKLGTTVVQLVTAQLLHCFNLELADNLDKAEKFGLTVQRANHLMAIPTYRLQTNI
ncbi:hypothetical protein ACHQM5_018772 [Ranunculus cassubicifolius]